MKCSLRRWHLDEVFVKINGERRCFWRALDHEGEVLASFVTRTRDKKAALNFLKKAMRKHGRGVRCDTDRLRSYGATLKDLGAADRQEAGRWHKNRAENSRLVLRRRERAMLRFRRRASLQESASVCASVTEHFNADHSLSSRGARPLHGMRDSLIVRAETGLGLSDRPPALQSVGLGITCPHNDRRLSLTLKL
jgi:putative transposase